MDPQTLGLYGGIAGGVFGVLGGLVGTACSVVNTRGRREWAFVVRCALLTWAVLAVSLGVAWLLPGPVRWLGMMPLFLALRAVPAWNRRQEVLRREEAGERG